MGDNFFTSPSFLGVIYFLCVISLIGNICIIITWLTFIEWSSKMPTVKRLLFLNCFLEIFMNAFFLYMPGSEDEFACFMQAIAQDIGFTLAAVMTGFIALETAYICFQMFHNPMGRVLKSLVKTKNFTISKREWCYYLFSLCYFIFTTITMTISYVQDDPDFGLSSFGGNWCWYKDYTLKVVSLSIGWVGLSTDIICTSYVSYEIGRRLIDKDSLYIIGNKAIGGEEVARQSIVEGDNMRSVSNINIRAANDSDTSYSINASNRFPDSILSQMSQNSDTESHCDKVGSLKNTFRRLILDCSVYVLFWLPGSIRWFSNGEIAPKWLIGLDYFSLSLGLFKFMIWVAFDTKVRTFWLNMLRNTAIYLHFTNNPSMQNTRVKSRLYPSFGTIKNPIIGDTASMNGSFSEEQDQSSDFTEVRESQADPYPEPEYTVNIEMQ